MILKTDNILKIKSTEIGNDWESFNIFQNRFNIKTTDYDARYPKYLLISALKELNEFCQDYYIDASKYQYIEVTKNVASVCLCKYMIFF